MPEKIGLEAVFETEQFKRGAKDYISLIDKSETVTNDMADALTRLGADFTNLQDDISKTAARFRASTPANIKYAQSYDQIVREFAEGKITSQQAADALDKLQREMRETGSAAEAGSQKSRLFWTELNSMIGVAKQVISSLGDAAREMYAFTRSGADLEWTATKFERLAETIGTTGDALRDDLKVAMEGLVSDSAAVAQATDLISLGLVNSHDQAVRMTRAVTLLGADMNEVVLTLTNQTTRRFDQIGVAVGGFDQRLEALKQQGYDTNGAFTEAFLQQAEAQLEKVGSIAEESIGKFMKLEASWGNLMDTFRTKSTALSPVITWTTKLVNLEVELQKAVGDGRKTQLEANAVMAAAVIGTYNLDQAVNDLQTSEKELNGTNEEAVDTATMLARKRTLLMTQTAENVRTELDMKEATDTLKKAHDLGIITLEEYTLRQAFLEAGLMDTEEAVLLNEEGLQDLIKAEEDQIKEAELLEEQTKQTAEEQRKLAEAVAAVAAGMRDQVNAIAELATKMEEWDAATKYQEIKNAAQEWLDAGIIGIGEYNKILRNAGIETEQFTAAGWLQSEAMKELESIYPLISEDVTTWSQAQEVARKAAEDGKLETGELGRALQAAGLLAEQSAESTKVMEGIMNQLSLDPAIEQAQGLANPLLTITGVPAYQKKVIDVITTMTTIGGGGNVTGNGGGWNPYYARGGPISAGQPAIVGDGGRPEVFVPGSDGYIFPSLSSFKSAMGGMGNVSNTRNFNLNMNVQNANPQTVQRSFEMMKLLTR